VGQLLLEDHPAFVDRFPHLARDPGAHHAGIVARLLHDAQHIAGVVAVAQHEVEYIGAGIIGTELGLIGRLLPHRDDDRAPFVAGIGGIAGQRHAETRLDQARGIFGPFEIAEQPESAICGTSEHRVVFPFRLSRPEPSCPWCPRPARN
jgi:hypothetical protein